MRTVLAFILAPAFAPLFYATIAATMRPPTEGPTWFDSFTQYFLLACLVSYLLSLTFGTVVFLLLRQTKRESLAAYASLGAPGGLLYFASIGVDGKLTPGLFATGASLTLLGLGVSTSFALIRGVPRQPIPREITA